MRVLILFAGASLALSACGKNDQAGTSQNAADGLTAEKIVANDVTAIDAVTGDAANMAADVDYNAEDNSLDNAVNALESKPAAKPAPKPARTSPRPAANVTANVTGNAAE
jgi:hypothetical protein